MPVGRAEDEQVPGVAIDVGDEVVPQTLAMDLTIPRCQIGRLLSFSSSGTHSDR
jgi:hypothetical protein